MSSNFSYSPLEILVVGANDVALVRFYPGVNAVIRVNALVLTSKPMKTLASQAYMPYPAHHVPTLSQKCAGYRQCHGLPKAVLQCIRFFLLDLLPIWSASSPL